MSSLDISLIALGCLLGGVLLGMWLQYLLPNHHLSRESQDTVKLGAGMVATMSALILGLLVSSSKSAFDAVNVSIAQTGAKIIMLDHLLADYGTEAGPLRAQLKSWVTVRVEAVWSTQKSAPSGMKAVEQSNTMLDFQSRLLQLTPKSDLQRSLLAQMQQVSSDLWQTRLLLVEQQQEGLPTPLVVLLVFWLTLLFASFGLFAPRNTTVFIVLLVCATAVASAIFLILEMSHPLDGFIKVSDAPLVKSLELIGR
jgi:hypothetical protein